MSSVYVETSIPAHLRGGCEPGSDLPPAARREITRTWWADFRSKHELYVSEIVHRELTARPSMESVDNDDRRTIEVEFAQIPELVRTREVDDLAETYARRLGLTEHRDEPFVHLAYAAVHRIDFVLTWNRRLLDARLGESLYRLHRDLDVHRPVLCTPMQLDDCFDDPIVAEVRAARLAILAECDYDLNKLFERLRESQRRHGDRLVTRDELRRQRGESGPTDFDSP